MRSGVNHAAHYIGGEWRGGTSSATADIINPATLESLGNIALAEQAEVAAAVDAASAAFPQWRRTPPQERIQYLFHFKQLLHQHADEIARITTMESRPFPEADGHQRDRRRKQADDNRDFRTCPVAA